VCKIRKKEEETIPCLKKVKYLQYRENRKRVLWRGQDAGLQEGGKKRAYKFMREKKKESSRLVTSKRSVGSSNLKCRREKKSQACRRRRKKTRLKKEVSPVLFPPKKRRNKERCRVPKDKKREEKGDRCCNYEKKNPLPDLFC